MGKYLLIWELNIALTAVDAKERKDSYGLLSAVVKQDIESGLLKDWGMFVGEGSGYCVIEGSEVQVNKMTEQYGPYVQFRTHPIISIKQVDEVINSLAG
jgi:hypothetical protein